MGLAEFRCRSSEICLIVFCRGVHVAKNSSRPANVRTK